VVCKDDVVKYILSGPILKGRLGKWMMALAEFDLRYELEKGCKGRNSCRFIGRTYWVDNFGRASFVNLGF
jgi:hypothetical protein